ALSWFTSEFTPKKLRSHLEFVRPFEEYLAGKRSELRAEARLIPPLENSDFEGFEVSDAFKRSFRFLYAMDREWAVTFHQVVQETFDQLLRPMAVPIPQLFIERDPTTYYVGEVQRAAQENEWYQAGESAVIHAANLIRFAYEGSEKAQDIISDIKPWLEDAVRYYASGLKRKEDGTARMVHQALLQFTQNEVSIKNLVLLMYKKYGDVQKYLHPIKNGEKVMINVEGSPGRTAIIRNGKGPFRLTLSDRGVVELMRLGDGELFFFVPGVQYQISREPDPRKIDVYKRGLKIQSGGHTVYYPLVNRAPIDLETAFDTISTEPFRFKVLEEGKVEFVNHYDPWTPTEVEGVIIRGGVIPEPLGNKLARWSRIPYQLVRSRQKAKRERQTQMELERLRRQRAAISSGITKQAIDEFLAEGIASKFRVIAVEPVDGRFPASEVEIYLANKQGNSANEKEGEELEMMALEGLGVFSSMSLGLRERVVDGVLKYVYVVTLSRAGRAEMRDENTDGTRGIVVEKTAVVSNLDEFAKVVDAWSSEAEGFDFVQLFGAPPTAPRQDEVKPTGSHTPWSDPNSFGTHYRVTLSHALGEEEVPLSLLLGRHPDGKKILVISNAEQPAAEAELRSELRNGETEEAAEALKKLGFEIDDKGRIAYGENFRPTPLNFEFIIVPHGRTPANDAKLFQGGESDGEPRFQLNTEGWRQAQKTASLLWHRLRHRIIRGERIYFLTSPLTRAVQTSLPFKQHVLGLNLKDAQGRPIRVDWKKEPLLTEYVVGEWGDKNRNQLQDNPQAVANKARNVFAKPEKGESYAQFLVRVQAALETFNQRYPKGTVIAIGHSSWIGAAKILTGSEGVYRVIAEKGYIDWGAINPGNEDRGIPVHLNPLARSEVRRNLGVKLENIDERLKLEGRTLAAVIGVSVLVAFSFIEPSLAAYAAFFGAVLFGIGLTGIASVASLPPSDVIARSPQDDETISNSRLIQKTKDVFLIGIDGQFPVVDLKALGLRRGDRVVVLDSAGKRDAFDFYSQVEIPGVNIVRHKLNGRQPTPQELKKLLSKQPNSFPIILFSAGFDLSFLTQYQDAAQREGYLAATPWTESARRALSDLLGRVRPEELTRLGLGEPLQYRKSEDGLISLKVNPFMEEQFAQTYFDRLNHQLASDRITKKAA
ncbi:MAG: histidine phosphatase family protein, partial [Candidatus Omnitrophica bacterium]|nr:histidine phosphatase family protein [Candidatus Omnitrophota bacterium]